MNQKIGPASALATCIDELDSSVKIMEKRPLAEHVSVSEVEPLWPIVSQKGLMHSTTRTLLELAFDHGGFVAGGFGRWAATSGRTPHERGEYVASGGDLDLFFHSRDGWKSYLHALGSIHDVDKVLATIGLSQGGLAVNFVPRANGSKEYPRNGPMPMQAVGCAVGTPQQILRSFDFVNCMFAFDRDGSWSADEAIALEKERVLGVASWSSRGLVHRLIKYRQKYGYLRARDLSCGRRVDHLCDAAGRYTTQHMQERAAQWWSSFLLSTSRDFFEDRSVYLDIMTCGILPFDESARLSMEVVNHPDDKLPDAPNPEWRGSYLAGVQQIRQREERAKQLSQEQYDKILDDLAKLEVLFDDEADRWTRISQVREAPDAPSWSADEYCWSF